VISGVLASGLKEFFCTYFHVLYISYQILPFFLNVNDLKMASVIDRKCCVKFCSIYSNEVTVSMIEFISVELQHFSVKSEQRLY
jgi:hypothetical protein